MSVPKRLSILRHAKSDWGDPGLADFDRPLNKRGRAAAKAVRRAINDRGLTFDYILSSPSVRTRETLERLGLAERAHWEEALYQATRGMLMRIVKSLPASAESALIVGHNPGVHEIVLDLTRSDQKGRRDSISGKFPTCALASITFDCAEWSELTAGSGTIAELILPRELD